MGNKHDAVHKPAHYTDGRKYEPKDVIRDWKLNFNIGSAVKYLSRAGRKDDIVQDLRKAQEFIQFEIDAIEADRKNAPKDLPLDEYAKYVAESDLCIMEVAVPLGADPEDIIKAFISELYGGELRCR